MAFSKWSADTKIIFDDGEFSAIWGKYDNGPRNVLGLRWNGSEDWIGFSSTRGVPTWFVVPTPITGAVLSSLLERVLKGGYGADKVEAITSSYREFEQQIFSRQPMLVIALFAAQSRGKTSTLKALIELLLKKGARTLYSDNCCGVDKRVVLNYKDFIVGICTGGDEGGVVERNFEVFNQYQCDVAFCATRKRSDSSSWVQFWANTRKRGVRHEIEEKKASAAGSSEAQQTADNLQRAQELFTKYLGF